MSDKLREAAQAVVQCFDTHGFVLQHRIKALRDALAEPESEYQLVGRFTGTLNGRFVFAPADNSIWPIGTALYAETVGGNT